MLQKQSFRVMKENILNIIGVTELPVPHPPQLLAGEVTIVVISDVIHDRLEAKMESGFTQTAAGFSTTMGSAFATELANQSGREDINTAIVKAAIMSVVDHELNGIPHAYAKLFAELIATTFDVLIPTIESVKVIVWKFLMVISSFLIEQIQNGG